MPTDQNDDDMTDFLQLAAEAEEGGEPEPEAAEAAEVAGEEKPPAEEEPKAEAKEETSEAEQQEEGDEEPEGVLSADGKRIIPYAELKNARKRISELEQQQEKEEPVKVEGIEDLEAKKAKAEAALKEAEELADDEMIALAQSAVDGISLAISERTARAQQDQVSAQAEAEAMEEAIDNHPAMGEWRTSDDPRMWDRAVALNTHYSATNPDYMAMPISERFDMLARVVAAELGIDAPGKPGAGAADPDQAIKDAKAAARTGAPKSLSSVPTGKVEDSQHGQLEDFDDIQAYMLAHSDDPEAIDRVLLQQG